MTRTRGWRRRGKPLVAKVPHGRWKTLTFLAALRQDAITAPFVLDGPINGEAFLAYVEQILVPTLKPGDVVVMDSGSAIDAARRMLGCDFNAAAKWCRATLFGDRPPASFTGEDRVAREFEREEDRRKKREEDEARWRAVQRRAIEIVESHGPANPCHPRLLCKKVGAHGILQMEDKIVIPMKNAGGEIWNVQLIRPDGEKRNLPGGLKTGLAFRIGHACGNRIFVLGEGYTTAASIYEACRAARSIMRPRRGGRFNFRNI